MKTVGVVDYGTGNLGSLTTVFESLGIYAEVVRDPERMAKTDLMVLPGVGAAGLAMERLENSGMADGLRERHSAGRPILGICLGAQLLCGFLREGECEGFGWIKASVEPLTEYPFFNNGWCRLDFSALRKAGLARALSVTSTFYFNHRYAMGRDAKTKCVAVEGRPDLPAIYLDEVICAVQFHPEKSQREGRVLLRNILEDHYGL
jgi:imidazole glycerol-phosphate synthase subunit HisH